VLLSTLIYPRFFFSNVPTVQFSAKARYAHHTPNYALSGFFVLLLPVSWFGWYFTYVRWRLCADLHENTRVTCVWMRLSFLNAFCCFWLTLQVRGAPARRQLRKEAWGIAEKCSTYQCQSSALIVDDIHGCLHTIPFWVWWWKCALDFGSGGGLPGLIFLVTQFSTSQHKIGLRVVYHSYSCGPCQQETLRYICNNKHISKRVPQRPELWGTWVYSALH
jgi:hypothetical protein